MDSAPRAYFTRIRPILLPLAGLDGMGRLPAVALYGGLRASWGLHGFGAASGREVRSAGLLCPLGHRRAPRHPVRGDGALSVLCLAGLRNSCC